MFWSVVAVFKNKRGRLILFSLASSFYFIFSSLKAGVAAAAAMDYLTPQFPTLSAESTDIFSLSDQILSDRLEFIEEAGPSFDVHSIL